MTKPIVDLSDCILCGICEDVCAEVFRLNSAGYIEVAELSDYSQNCISDAIKNCPAKCISQETP